MAERSTYPVEIAGVKRELTLFEVKPGVKIAVLNILGDTELVEAAAQELVEKLGDSFEAFVTAESKSIPLAYALSVKAKKPYIVLRKDYKPLGDALQTETLSITTGRPQKLYLDEKDRNLINGKRVVIVDDVISTGSTLQGMRSLMDQSNAEVVAEAAIFTEGDEEMWDKIVSLGHLPVFVE